MKTTTRAEDPPAAWEVRDSPIHGTGLFATRPISAGGRILEYKGGRVPKTVTLRRAAQHPASSLDNPRIFTFSIDDQFDLDGGIPGNPAKYANHSCDENCDAILKNGRLWLFAARDIAPCEELTLDYAFPLETFFEHPCRCGSPRCAGYIVARPDRLKLRLLLARARRRAAPAPQKTAYPPGGES